MADTKTEIKIPSFDIQTIELRLVGDTPLICHAWSEKAKRQIFEASNKQAKNKKHEDRKPYCDFANSLYWLTPKPNFDEMSDAEAQEVLTDIIPTSKFGFPVTAFKAAALDGGFQQGLLVSKAGTAQLAKTTARGAIHIFGEYTVIKGTPTIREDMVRVGQGTDFRWRGEFKTWETTLTIRFNAGAISAAQIVSCFNAGGFANGVGERRPAKGDSYGTFHVE